MGPKFIHGKALRFWGLLIAMKASSQVSGMSASRNMYWRCVLAGGRSLCWRICECGCRRRLHRGCCMCMREGLPTVRVLVFIFEVVACLTTRCSWRSENDAAGPWVPFRFSYKQDAILSEVCPCDSFHLLGPKWIHAFRTKETFDIIINFPDSMDALYDLREFLLQFHLLIFARLQDCLQHVDQCANLISSLWKSYTSSSFKWFYIPSFTPNSFTEKS